MVPDPYRALGLSHDASAHQIKVAYRKLALQYHPDRLTARNASQNEMREAILRFAAASSAYQLLSDNRRKREYDHIYKYGGYDQEGRPERPTYQPPHATMSQKPGIGYKVFDPLAYLLTGNSRRAVAGVQIPSRVHLANPPAGAGLRFAFSSGECTKTKTGAKKYVSKTTQFVHGKKFSRVETTVVHPDGRKEVIIEGNDYVQRRYSTPPKKKVVPQPQGTEDDVSHREGDELPWYTSAWNGICDRLTWCHNPCGAILAQ